MNKFKTNLIIENRFTGKKKTYEFDTFDIAYRIYKKINNNLFKVAFIKSK